MLCGYGGHQSAVADDDEAIDRLAEWNQPHSDEHGAYDYLKLRLADRRSEPRNRPGHQNEHETGSAEEGEHERNNDAAACGCHRCVSRELNRQQRKTTADPS